VCEREVAATRPAAAEPPEELVWRDLRPVLDEAVASLPEPYRMPFVLCYLKSRTVSEAARELGWPRGTVATRLAVARQRLRARLASRGVTLSAGALGGALTSGVVSARPPVSLLVSTARAATVAAGHGMVTAAGPATAAAVAQGGKARGRTRVTVALLVAVGVAGGGVGMYWQRTGERDKPAAASASARPQEPTGTHGARIAATVNGQVISAPALPQEPAGIHGARIGATVNGVPIFAEEVYVAAYLSLSDFHHPAGPDFSRRIMAVWRKTLDRVVEREVILQAAVVALRARNAQAVEKLRQVAVKEFDRRWVKAATRSAGLKGDEELCASLRAQGTSLEAVRREWVRDFVAEEYLRSRILRGRDPGAIPSEEDARQERARIVAELKRQAVIEYAGGR
jgi:hypothetical protein